MIAFWKVKQDPTGEHSKAKVKSDPATFVRQVQQLGLASGAKPRGR